MRANAEKNLCNQRCDRKSRWEDDPFRDVTLCVNRSVMIQTPWRGVARRVTVSYQQMVTVAPSALPLHSPEVAFRSRWMSGVYIVRLFHYVSHVMNCDRCVQCCRQIRSILGHRQGMNWWCGEHLFCLNLHDIKCSCLRGSMIVNTVTVSRAYTQMRAPPLVYGASI